MRLFKSVWMIGLALSMLAHSSWANTSPKGVIEDSYRSLRVLIDTKQLVAGMPQEELFVMMERELTPVVDFERIARKVMGKYARRASADDLQRFTVKFKQTLVATYSKGLENLDRLQSAEIADPAFNPEQNLAKVPMTIALSGGESYSVVYSMFKNEQQNWLVENIVVEGVNIGLVMRNQFAHYMDQYNDVAQAISHWGE